MSSQFCDILNPGVICLDDENELPLKVIASFSVSMFCSAINYFNSSPQLDDICLRVQRLNKISQCMPSVCVDVVLDVIF